MDRRERAAWIAFNAAPHMGPVRFKALLGAFGGMSAALKAGAADLKSLFPRLQPGMAGEILEGARNFDSAAEEALAASHGARILTLGEEDYPEALRESPGAAPVIYVQGRFPVTRMLGVVGTRTPTSYGASMAKALAGGLARAGAAVVSGLARGIDALAHRSCLDQSGATVAVLGSGLLDVYPREHSDLARDIAVRGGAVISQFALRASPERWRFPMRNSVLAGLVSGLVVVEGAEDSGSLITAREALEYGRDIFAVPGPATSELSRGANKLIQAGAKLVLDARDVLSDYPEFAGALEGLRPERAKAPALSGEEGRLVELVRQAGQLSMSELVERSGMSAGEAGAKLTLLEIKGVLRQRPGSLVEAV